MGDKTVSVRVRFEGGDQVKAGLQEVGREGTRAIESIGNVSRQAGNNLQNAGYQVSDFFVQVAGGTAPSRALAQQLPQLLQGFGLIGVAASVLVAALPSLWSLFSDGAQEVKGLDERIKGLSDSIGNLQDINDLYSTDGVQKLIDKYGELNAQVLLLLERQRRQAEGAAMTQARSVSTGFAAEFDGLSDLLREYQSVLQLIEKNNYGDVQAQKQRALVEVTESLNAEYGVTLERALQINEALARMGSAKTVSEMATAASTLSGFLEGSALAGTELASQLLEAEDKLRMLNAEGDGIGGWLGAAVDWASGLADKLWSGADAAAAIRNGSGGMGPKSTLAGGRSAGNGGPEIDPYGFRDQLARDQARSAASLNVPRSVGGGGGGGGGGADPDIARAKALTEGVRTETEKYAIALEEVNRLKQRGLITDETYNRQIDKLGDKLDELGDLGRKAASAIRGAFDNLFDDPAAALKDLTEQLAMMALYSGLAKAFPGAFGGGGAVPLVPGFASGGRHKGGLRIVGENGPELEATGPSMIYPNDMLRSMGRTGGGGTVVNVNNFSGEPVEQSRSRGSDGQEIIDVIVGRSLSSGRLDKPMRGRFAAQPSRIKR